MEEVEQRESVHCLIHAIVLIEIFSSLHSWYQSYGCMAQCLCARCIVFPHDVRNDL